MWRVSGGRSGDWFSPYVQVVMLVLVANQYDVSQRRYSTCNVTNGSFIAQRRRIVERYPRLLGRLHLDSTRPLAAMM